MGTVGRFSFWVWDNKALSENVSAKQNRSWHRRWAGQIQHTACRTGVRRDPCRSERKQYCSRKQKFREYGVLINAYVCDARDLSALNLSTFDNVLIMGPMYHLPDAEDRKKCVLQAKKYLAKNWVLFASFITITVGLNYYLDTAPELLLHEPAMDLFDRMEIDESWSGTAFTKATFINTTEVLTFFDELGFKKLALLEQEGLTGPRLTEIENKPKRRAKPIRKFLCACVKTCSITHTAIIFCISESKRTSALLYLIK